MNTHGNGAKLGIAIVQWNHSSNTIKLLDALLKSPIQLEICICDNNSNPSETNKLNQFINSDRVRSHKSSKTTLILNTNNSGFSNGTNACLIELQKKAEIEWFWLLNPDTSPQSNSISSLLEELEDKTPGIYGTKLNEPAYGEFYGGFSFSKWTSKFKPINNPKDYQDIRLTNTYISGANMIIRLYL
jgi:GT2 family glycosyltransferase